MAQSVKTAPAVQKKGMSKELRESLVAYSFIAPNFIGFCIFTLVPMIFAIALAFCDWDGVHSVEFVGLQNFIEGVVCEYHCLYRRHGAPYFGLRPWYGRAVKSAGETAQLFPHGFVFPVRCFPGSSGCCLEYDFQPVYGPC